MSSGHNPHSRVSQPVNSSSWNHLQVPSSYMPRQPPQLAHMSSERTLRSSPLIWPNTNPADAFYNYMALTAAAAVANSNPKNVFIIFVFYLFFFFIHDFTLILIFVFRFTCYCVRLICVNFFRKNRK